MYTNKQIIGLCPNFYKIIEFSPYEDDIISKRVGFQEKMINFAFN